MQSRDASQAILSRAKDPMMQDDLRLLTRLAIREDLDRGMDLTTMAIVPSEVEGKADVVARVNGVVAGMNLIDVIVSEFDCSIEWDTLVGDGEKFSSGQPLMTLRGEARDLLTCERTILNFLGRLCGIATLTNQFVERIRGTKANVFDTRKTTPGWRRLEKYAVLCGGGCNHRMGLYDAILIKDNHLASRAVKVGVVLDAGEAVREAYRFLDGIKKEGERPIVQVEVDSIDQLSSALDAAPDIVLLDNMNCDQLTACVRLRDRMNPSVELEASGGVNINTIAAIAATGVERISVGALTHSAVNLDLGLDWRFG